jgi:hypothetical protein
VSIAYVVEQLQVILRLPWCPKRQFEDTTNDFAPDFFLKSTEKNPGIFYGYKNPGNY